MDSGDGPRIAYLILCHEHPQLLARLIRAIDHPDDVYVVHVDRKADIEAFRTATAGQPRLHWVEPRVAVHWAGYSVVEATLAALRNAMALQPRAQRFCLLSGSSYPVLATPRLRELLLSRKVLMRAKEVQPSEHDYQRVSRWHLAEHPLLNGRQPADSKLWSELRGVVEPFLQSLPPLPPLPVTLWKGQQWWSIDRNAAQTVLDFVRNPDYAELMQRFRYAHAPDELLIQSIVFESREHRPRPKASTHYVDWTPEPGSKPPRVLHTAEDLIRMLLAGAPFARKFDPVRSARLLRWLDYLRKRGVSMQPKPADRPASDDG